MVGHSSWTLTLYRRYKPVPRRRAARRIYGPSERVVQFNIILFPQSLASKTFLGPHLIYSEIFTVPQSREQA
jgi:hypothetical protein